ncbi:hypothetical protein IKG20_02460 [Candidatus Saccharibacteria bacterium]|nr:hypothetical protein [Candidatus Saccharibacteria bacterium]
MLNKIKRIFLSLGAVFTALFFSLNVLSTPVFADPETNVNNNTSEQQNQSEENQSENTSNNTQENSGEQSSESTNTCYDEAGSLGWLVCPTTGFLARITDSLYGIIKDLLIVKPLTSDSDSPFHQIWSIFRDITNVVFVIFFLIIIASQVSGIGISNYGIKKLLPKIIISAILINLSYIICAALVDVSNIVGSSVKDLFTNVEEQVTATGLIASAEGVQIDFTSIVAGLVGGTLLGGLAVGATGGLGAIFIGLLPVLIGAVLAVGIAYLTIAARQAFVYLLIMVSPLAFVCNLLPNTEKWFNDWKKALLQMLFFFPMFAALFGACSLVGWTIIASADEPIRLILGIAVKVVPLFAAWPLLKMSGTLPGQINSALTKAIQKPAVGAVSRWSKDEAAYRRAKYLGEKPRAWQYGRQFGQGIQNRNFRRASDTAAYLEAAKNRGAAFSSNYKNSRGKVTGRGKSMQALIEQNLRNKQQVTKNANDYEKGLSSQIDPNSAQYQAVLAQDLRNRDSADDLITETARGEMIARDNAESRHERFDAALTAHSQDALYGRKVDQVALEHYNRIKGIMGGDTEYTHYAGAYAANAHAVQDKIIDGKFMNYFDYIPATQEVVNRLKDLTNAHKSNQYIDSIVMGMKTLSLRGDTDLIKLTIDDVLEDGQIQLGTHASQSLANFLMFDVNNKDPLLRRYGKYINLETARAFNETSSGTPLRINRVLTFDEYITGKFQEYNPTTKSYYTGKVKRDAVVLMEGTSLDGVERTAYENMDASLRKAYTNPETGEVDYEAMTTRRNEIYNSILPAFISASLKYPSGSEQIQNQASWLTGYKLKDGKWLKRWEDPSDSLYGLDPNHFKDQTNLFISAQTSGQILGIRTDLLLPLIESLADQRSAELIKEKKLDENWEEAYEEKEGDSDEDKKRKKEERKSKRLDLAGEKIREIEDKKGNLELIFKSRRSGATLNSKPQLRDMFKLNDDVFIAEYLAKKAAERKARQEEAKRKFREEGIDVDNGESPAPTYDNHEFFIDTMNELFDEGLGADDFYNQSVEKLKQFGLDYIATKYKEYHDANPGATADDLFYELNDLLDNPDNYV